VSTNEHPKIVDLRSYKLEAKARAARAAAAQRKAAKLAPAGGKQPVLGARPNAGLILALFAIFFLALWLGPRLMQG
jgi:hypothetical protein